MFLRELKDTKSIVYIPQFTEHFKNTGIIFDEISIYPHNNTSLEEYPEVLVAGDEVHKKKI